MIFFNQTSFLKWLLQYSLVLQFIPHFLRFVGEEKYPENLGPFSIILGVKAVFHIKA